jgi:hypothetical protein
VTPYREFERPFGGKNCASRFKAKTAVNVFRNERAWHEKSRSVVTKNYDQSMVVVTVLASLAALQPKINMTCFLYHEKRISLVKFFVFQLVLKRIFEGGKEISN